MGVTRTKKRQNPQVLISESVKDNKRF